MRCDGLVVATPAGSTGYNLANGGPVLAWGVEGFVVSFIAPHSLTARPLVVAPGGHADRVDNRSRDEPVDVSVDGRPAGELAPGEALAARFVREAALLAQLPGSTFYRRLREKFGGWPVAASSAPRSPACAGRARRSCSRRSTSARSVPIKSWISTGS